MTSTPRQSLDSSSN